MRNLINENTYPAWELSKLKKNHKHHNLLHYKYLKDNIFQ